jgi:hypothetical protein
MVTLSITKRRNALPLLWLTFLRQTLQACKFFRPQAV